jgi:hypothetical protein
VFGIYSGRIFEELPDILIRYLLDCPLFLQGFPPYMEPKDLLRGYKGSLVVSVLSNMISVHSVISYILNVCFRYSHLLLGLRLTSKGFRPANIVVFLFASRIWRCF